MTDFCPFDLHFAEPGESELAEQIEKIENIKKNQWVTLRNDLAPAWSSISRIPANPDDRHLIGHEPMQKIHQVTVSGPRKLFFGTLILL